MFSNGFGWNSRRLKTDGRIAPGGLDLLWFIVVLFPKPMLERSLGWQTVVFYSEVVSRLVIEIGTPGEPLAPKPIFKMVAEDVVTVFIFKVSYQGDKRFSGKASVLFRCKGKMARLLLRRVGWGSVTLKSNVIRKRIAPPRSRYRIDFRHEQNPGILL